MTTGHGRRGVRGHLTEEDIRLWEMMKQRLEPLKRAKRRVHAHDDFVGGAEPMEASRPPLPSRPVRAPSGAGSTVSRGSADAMAPRPAPKPAAPPLPTVIERRKARQIARNQRPIDAVLDLHGMRQREAHAQLRAFLLSAHGRELKLVKVITGKGQRGDNGAAPQRAWSDSVHDAGERGVLKRLVPEWLHEPELRRVVVAFSSAGRGHGGEGALYVELRRKSRVR